MLKAIITVGISASGKTTWAEDFAKQLRTSDTHWYVVSRDTIRSHILDEKGLITNHSYEGVEWSKWNWKWENIVTANYWKDIEMCVARGWNIICADTNLKKERRDQLIDRLTQYGYEVEIKRFDIDFEEAVKRDAARPNGVGAFVIAQQYQSWIEDCVSEGLMKQYKPDNKLPAAYLCDIDGTLAIMGKRSPYEWHKVGLDTCRRELAEIIRTLKEKGYKIIFLSGRDSVCRNETTQWLDDNDIPYDDLYMRNKDDKRKDVEVKSELFWNHIDQHYNVMAMFDDRPVMNVFWRSINVPVFQLGNQFIWF